MQLPLNGKLPINLFASSFNKTTSTYKYYWLISILEIVVEENKNEIPVRDILIKMICNAWYPIHYFKLSFDILDLLNQNSKEIQRITDFPIDSSKNNLFSFLNNNKDRNINALINHFGRYVPYRFLSPWFSNKTDKEIFALSQDYSNDCFYRFISKKNYWNKSDLDKLSEKNYRVLIYFCYWNLTIYLQSKIPNVPDIPNKLIKPVKRVALNSQRKFWNIVFDKLHYIPCIYTNEKLIKANFDVEHFIPYSFVSHDLIWNLIPANTNINSSKGNKLPRLNDFFDEFVNIQQIGIKTVYEKQPRNKLLEDYLVLGGNIKDVINLPFESFKSKYYNVMSPLLQIAENMGFEYWNFNKPKNLSSKF